jgi:murein DD-endopeptidase MepM/ murein hydrolase activator NlpD
MRRNRRLSLLLPLLTALLLIFVARASAAQIATITHQFQSRVAGTNIQNAILTQRCLTARYHWLTSEELAPRSMRFGPWRYNNQPINGCVTHAPYVQLASETVKVCVGASDTLPGTNSTLYEHDENRCHICTRTQNGAGNALTCTEVFNLFGRISSATGAALANVQVSNGAGGATLTDAAGVFTLTNLSKAAYTITAFSEGITFSPTVRHVGADAPYNLRGLDFRALPPTAPPPTSTLSFTLSGRVLDTGEGGIGGVLIAARSVITPGNLVSTASAISDQDGRYVLSRLISGTIIISASKPSVLFSQAAQTIDLTADRADVNFQASNRYAISGRLTDSTGVGLAATTVTCATIGATSAVQSDGAGFYRCGDLARGIYLVSFGADKRGWMIVPPNRGTVDFTLAATTGGVVGKALIATTNKPLAAAEIIAVEQGVRSTSNADGAFALSLDPGIHTLRASAAGYLDLTQQVSVTVGVSKTLDLALKPVPVDGFRLPYPAGAQYACLQANNQDPTHRGNWSYAFDFGIPLGNLVAAARAGRVITVVDKYTLTCTENTFECRNSANYIRLRHIDGSDTLYYHLQNKSALVKVGDWVTSGQPIARSGKTGLVLGPTHLDFTRHRASGWVSIPVSFLDVAENDGKPKRNKTYLSQNPPAAQAAEALAMLEMPPQGQISLGVVQTRTVAAQIDVVGMAAEVTEMRLAETLDAVEQASWVTATPTVEWSAPAIFAQFKDGEGLVSPVLSDTLLALVYAPITPTFAISPTVCVGEPLSLQNRTTPYCTQCGWEWDFGNAVKSRQIEPMFDYTGASSFFGYATPGQYTVTLTVTNFYSQSSAAQVVEALPNPSAAFSLIADGATITATAVQTDATAWLWTVGERVLATATPVLTYTYSLSDTADPNAFVVGLTVSAANGCHANAQQLALLQRVYLPIVAREPDN